MSVETLSATPAAMKKLPVAPEKSDTLAALAAPGHFMALYRFAPSIAPTRRILPSSYDLQRVPDVDDVSHDDGDDFIEEGEERSFLDSLLLAQWEDRMERGLFRYDVTSCETKVVPGSYGFIAQLNIGRLLKKRPTEFKVDRVLQAFDGTKFNFTKADSAEVLFRFEETDADGESTFHEMAPVTRSTNVVLINVSPIEYGHLLLVPRIFDCLPQRIEAKSLLLAMQFAIEVDNPYFRVAYNSLGAFATINHLHFQAYYLSAPFPIEMAPIQHVVSRKRRFPFTICRLLSYPVRVLVYELRNSLEKMAQAIAAACQILEAQNVAFNLLIADRGARVFLIPQCFAAKQARHEVPAELLELQVNPAAWEISGHIVVKRPEDYAHATEESVWQLLREVSLSERDFEDVVRVCVGQAERLNADNLFPGPRLRMFPTETRHRGRKPEQEVPSM